MKFHRILMLLFIASAPVTALAQSAGSDDAAPADYVAYDKAPEPQKMIQPKYPAAARTQGIQGTVWVKVWVGKDGKVKRAIVNKSDSTVLNDAAVEAATQWVFAPATARNNPVSVWVSVPFKFRFAK